MAVITRSEAKNFVLLDDTLVEQEAVTFPNSTAGRRLDNKGVNTIHRVATTTETSDTGYSTNDFYTTEDYAGYTLISNISTGSMSTGGAYKIDYSYGQYDDDIDRLLPEVERDICLYLNNWFEDRVIYKEAEGGIAFVSGTPDYITDDNDDFSTIGFTTDMDIAVRGGSNYGIHTLTAVATNKLTLDSTGVLVDQDQDASHHTVGTIRISRIDWPRELKPYVAQMIWYRIKHSRPSDVKSETIDDYSVTYIGEHQYPRSIAEGLNKWRQVVLI
jgi:hypothetical protein